MLQESESSLQVRGLLLAPVLLLLLLLLAGCSAEPQVLVLSSDKMPSIQPLVEAGAGDKGSYGLQNLHGDIERTKRSGNILQLLGSSSGSSSGGGSNSGSSGSSGGSGGSGGGGLFGGKGILGSLLGSSSSNSAGSSMQVDGKGPTYGNYIGTGAGLPMVSTK